MFLRFVLSTSLILFVCPLTYAQHSSFEDVTQSLGVNVQQPPVEYVERFYAKKMGISPDSPLYASLQTLLRTQGQALKQRELKIPDPSEIKVIKHLRSDDGIPLDTHEFPDLAKIGQGAINKIASDLNSGNFEIDFEMIRKKRNDLKGYVTPRELPPCFEDKTTKVRNKLNKRFNMLSALKEEREKRIAEINRAKGKGKKKVKLPRENIMLDMLFVHKDAPKQKENIQVEYSEMFGEKTRVIYYTSLPGDLFSMQGSNNGATCLPYRIRVTDKYRYIDTGKNALRNYDEKPQGKGVLHPLVKKRMHEYL